MTASRPSWPGEMGGYAATSRSISRGVALSRPGFDGDLEARMMSWRKVVGAHDRWRILWALETRFRRVTWFFAARCRLAGWRDGCDLRAVTRAVGAPEPAGPAAVRRSGTAGSWDPNHGRRAPAHPGP